MHKSTKREVIMKKIEETEREKEIRLTTEALLLDFGFWCSNCFQKPKIKVICKDKILRVIVQCSCSLGMKRVIHLEDLVSKKWSVQRELERFINDFAGEWKRATKAYNPEVHNAQNNEVL